jgi:hypothetical protein
MAKKLDTLDRRLLEGVILPELAAREGVLRVLFVGCAEYTRHYEALFAGREFYTIEIDPAAAVYGASVPGRHIVDSVENVARYLPRGRLDVILMNGVFGYGLDDPAAAEKTIQSCHDLLSASGLLMIGWNDLPQCKPFEPLELAALRQFERIVFPALHGVGGIIQRGHGSYMADDHYRHVFSFFARSAAPLVRR